MKKTFINPENILNEVGLKEDMVVADFGCGAGAWTIPAAFLVGEKGKVYALDILDHMLEVTGSKANKYKLSNVELIKVDIEVPQKIKIAEGSCDLIIISSIIFQLQDKNIVFESAKKILKKKGNILIIEWQPEGPLGPDKNLRLSKEKVIKLSEDNGFILDKEVDAGHFHYGLLIKIKNKHS